MPPTLSPDDLRIVLAEANAAARRLRRQLGLPAHDVEDLRQELLVDLIARLRHFDPERGCIGAFAGTVFRNRASRIAARVAGERRIFGAAPVSLNDPVPANDGRTLGDVIGNADGLSAWHGQPPDVLAAVECRLDVERALGFLDRRDAALCACVSLRTADRLAAMGLGSRSGLYRRLRDLRLVLTALGLRGAWDGFRRA